MLVVGISLVSLFVGFLALFVTHNSAIGTHTASSPGTHRTAAGQTMTTQPATASTQDTTSPAYWMQVYQTDTAPNPSFAGFRSSDQWDNNGNSCLLKNSGYEVFANPQDGFQPCFATGKSFKDFVYQVTMNIPAGGAGGVIFRADNNHAVYYRVSISPGATPNGGVWSALACTPKASCVNHGAKDGLLVSSGSVTIPQNQPVTLTVLVQNTSIALYANGNYLNHVDDTNDVKLAIPGQIGVYAVGFNSTVKVTFSNLQLWLLDSAK